MKKFFLSLIFVFTGIIPLFAQITVSPDDIFYTLVDNWKIRNVVSNVPPIKPYPLKNVLNILTEVMEKGSVQDKQNAGYLYNLITGKKFHVEVDVENVLNILETTESKLLPDNFFAVYPAVSGDLIFFKENVSFGYKAGLAIQSQKSQDSFLPMFEYSLHDISDFPVSFENAKLFLDASSAFSAGTSNIFMQTGVYRPKQALDYSETRSSNFSFTYLGNKISYAQNYSITENEKFKSFHTVCYDFTKTCSLSYYEYIIFDESFNPAYFLPLPYLLSTNLIGDNGNFSAGLDFAFNVSDSIQMKASLFADSIKYKSYAGKLFLTYAPSDSVCKVLKGGYEVITPYTYSGTETKPNLSFDSMLYEPNSDVISFMMTFMPLSRFSITIGSSFLRHANIADSYTESEALECLLANDGSIVTDGTKSACVNAASASLAHLNLLNQSNFMYVTKNSIDAEYIFPMLPHDVGFSIKAGFTFQYVKNYGVSRDIYPAGSIMENSDGSYTDSKTGTYADKETLYENAGTIAKAYKNSWEGSFIDRVNNYFSLGICFKW